MRERLPRGSSHAEASQANRCWLEWEPWGEDRVMGLNHQMSSLSCALAEAVFLNRTLLLPERMCIDLKHQQRVGRSHVIPDTRCAHHPMETGWSKVGRGVSAMSVPIEDLLDLTTISQLASISLLKLPRAVGQWVRCRAMPCATVPYLSATG